MACPWCDDPDWDGGTCARCGCVCEVDVDGDSDGWHVSVQIVKPGAAELRSEDCDWTPLAKGGAA